MDSAVVPEVSILMPAYNVEKHIGAAIESILRQSYKNFEFLIFNDGSTDKTAQIIQYYKDDRIKFFNYDQNTGYVKHLNKGITEARGKYIARMDADDISHPERLQRQVAFMEVNSDVGICGTWYNIIDDSNTVIKVPAEHDDLKVQLLYNSVFGHPSVIIRAKVLREHNKFYDIDFMPAEDFKLWVELSRISKLANMEEVLLHYRRHEAQISNYKKHLQLDKISAVRVMQVEYLLGRKLSFEELQMIDFLFGIPDAAYDAAFFNKSLRWATKLIKVNRDRKIYREDKLESSIASRLQAMLYRIKYSRSFLLNESKTLLLNQLSTKDKMKFYLKCLVNWKSA